MSTPQTRGPPGGGGRHLVKWRGEKWRGAETLIGVGGLRAVTTPRMRGPPVPDHGPASSARPTSSAPSAPATIEFPVRPAEGVEGERERRLLPRHQRRCEISHLHQNTVAIFACNLTPDEQPGFLQELIHCCSGWDSCRPGEGYVKPRRYLEGGVPRRVSHMSLPRHDKRWSPPPR